MEECTLEEPFEVWFEEKAFVVRRMAEVRSPIDVAIR